MKDRLKCLKPFQEQSMTARPGGSPNCPPAERCQCWSRRRSRRHGQRTCHCILLKSKGAECILHFDVVKFGCPSQYITPNSLQCSGPIKFKCGHPVYALPYCLTKEVLEQTVIKSSKTIYQL
eukprot:gnl/MRDRNA2_/MRDRNA2_83321_c0_seq3.p1 gnl/MRDRNA2_/MRDRNA2_83321_c0~~gnl/MRDRNA2_/MRDRNA2_83321_c0_seq3.p1  ORF type:complete len:122 (-),score=2.43 gnl/MRDRNA2_/MRDRNA2_83321_c0_seq3:233-598(-)